MIKVNFDELIGTYIVINHFYHYNYVSEKEVYDIWSSGFKFCIEYSGRWEF